MNMTKLKLTTQALSDSDGNISSKKLQLAPKEDIFRIITRNKAHCRRPNR